MKFGKDLPPSFVAKMISSVCTIQCEIFILDKTLTFSVFTGLLLILIIYYVEMSVVFPDVILYVTRDNYHYELLRNSFIELAYHKSKSHLSPMKSHSEV